MNWLLLWLPALAFSASLQRPLIQNGEEVAANDPLRYSVALIVSSRGRCSATFLTRETLLSAGHCFGGVRPASVKVRVRDAAGAWHERPARQVLVHPGYRLENDADGGWLVDNDFALVKIASAMPLAVKPLDMADPSGLPGDFAVTVAGFGWLAKNSASVVLRKGRMLARVENLPGFYGQPGVLMVPAAAPEQATCPGDSGGPVLLANAGRTYVIGVHSLSSGCQDGENTRSLSQMPVRALAWIRANLD